MGLMARFRSSLTYPIAATLVLVTVVPVALVGLLLASHNREHLTTVEKQYLTRQAVSLASEVNLYFSGYRTQLRATVRALEAGSALSPGAAESLLKSLANRNQGFVHLQILDPEGEGTFVRTRQLPQPADDALAAALQDAHSAALAGGEFEDLHVTLPRPASPLAVLGYPLRSSTGHLWGTLEAAIDFTSLQQRLLDNTYAGLLVSIIDSDGVVVVSSRPDLVGRSLNESPLVRDFRFKPLRITRVYPHPVDLTAGRVLGSLAPVEWPPWGVVVERPIAEAFATVRSMQLRTLLVTAIAALVALAVGFLISRRLTRPIQNLAGVTSEIAEGNLTVRANVSGHDEIARLAGNFNNMAGSIETLVRRLKQALRHNQELFLDTIRTLAAAIDAKDPYTRGHSERVSSYSMAVSRHLGLGPEEIFRIRIAAILHDVGKLGVRDGILNKPAGLTDEEYAIMRRHVEIGAQIMTPIRRLKDIIPGIRNHHETWDGNGYPDGLKGEEIPLVARIIGVADTFDAMTTTRPYQEAKSFEFVVARMRAMSGTRFDPMVIDALMAAVAAGDISPPSEDAGDVALVEEVQ